MSLISPKTIVITAYPGKHGISMQQNKSEFSYLGDSTDFDSDGGGSGPRKRRRLNHLTPDEKMLRRKLKNRVAAQTARDRKKALMQELEEKVARLEEENKLLRRQNLNLKETSTSLAQENASLKTRLSSPVCVPIKTEPESIRSAEGAGSDSVLLDDSVLRCHDGDDECGRLVCFYEDPSSGREQQQQEAQAAPSSSQGFGRITRADSGGSFVRAVSSSVQGKVVVKSEELESLKDLIHIDHVYVKSQPTVSSSKSSEDVFVDNVHRLDGSHIQEEEPLIPESQIYERPIDIDASNITVSNGDYTVSVVDTALIKQEVADDLDSLDNTNNMIDALTDTDIESSLPLNLLDHIQNGDIDLLSEIDNNPLTDSPNVDEKDSLDDLDALDFFNIDSFLKMDETANDPSSPLSNSNSDSDFYSDNGVESLSPESNLSLIDDLSWHESHSLSDLFPSLQ